MACTFEAVVVTWPDVVDMVLADPHPKSPPEAKNPNTKKIREEYSITEYPPRELLQAGFEEDTPCR
jgi:hypothetical protein